MDDAMSSILPAFLQNRAGASQTDQSVLQAYQTAADRPTHASPVAVQQSCASGISLTTTSPDAYPTLPSAQATDICRQIFTKNDASRLSLLVGASSSGLRDYINSIKKKAFHLPGSVFSTEESYNQVRGASQGYHGYGTPTEYVKYLVENPTGTVIIEGLHASDPSWISDFFLGVLNGRVVDKAQKYSPIDVSKVKYVFVVYDRLEISPDVDTRRLQDQLTKIRNANNQSVIPETLSSAVTPLYFYNFLDYPEKIAQVLCPLVGNNQSQVLTAATKQFFLTNSELFSLLPKTVRINPAEKSLQLLAGTQVFREFITANPEHYVRFATALNGYVGQELAVQNFQLALANKIKMEHASRPVSLLCIGPPGVGKTEIANRLGSAYESIVRIDCNVVQSVDDLFGTKFAPGQFSTQLTKGQPTIILFDEIEKLIPKTTCDMSTVLSLLQLFDEGRFVDKYNDEVWPLFDTIIVCTSNLIRDASISEEEARARLKQMLPEEFVDRINYITPFRLYTTEEKIVFAQKYANELKLVLDTDSLNRVIRADSLRQLRLNVQTERAMHDKKELDDLVAQSSRVSSVSR